MPTRNSCGVVLEEYGIGTSLYPVSDGQAALHYLLRQGEYSGARKSPRHHRILVGWRLPKINGFDAFGRQRGSRWPCSPRRTRNPITW